eukprot:SRR837773.17396.p2 GENE.SRR837773.17396~~SRR837773.17396.p2  ORF type:complete len:247 (+),score=88.65 SRR837773.17396:2-742(+)
MERPSPSKRAAPRGLALALVLAVLHGSQAAVVKQAQLRAAAPEAANIAPHTPLDASQRLQVALGGFAAFEKGVDEKGDEEFPAQQVTVQVPEKELKALTAKMSAGCKKQLFGETSQLHTFGDEGRHDKARCESLNGTLCSVSATVESAQAMAGRTMQSKSIVSGRSCLPKECAAEPDLEAYSKFMKLKAEGAFGAQASVAMSVDCAEHGGGSVAIAAKPMKPIRSAALQQRPAAAAALALVGLAWA